MSVFDTVRELKSFRSAKKKPVSRDKIGKILEAGRHAPSPGNAQSMEFIVIDSEESRRSLASATGDGRLEDAPTSIIVIEDIERMRREVGEACQSACNSESACAIHNMRLVAKEEGVSSCWITGFDEETIKSNFRIPKDKKVEGIVSLCYSDDEIDSEPRYGMNETVFYEAYDNQISSVFDEIEWEGIYEESEKVGKKFKKTYWKIRDLLKGII